MNRAAWPAAPAIGAAVLLAIAPFVLPVWMVTLLGYIGLYSIVCLGLVLLTGWVGITSFGQAAFVGLAAYYRVLEDGVFEVLGKAGLIMLAPLLAYPFITAWQRRVQRA